MSQFKGTMCCGLREFYGLCNDPKADMATLCLGWFTKNAYGDTHGAFIVFSDVSKGNASKLAKFITDNDLGTIQETDAVHNPSSNHQLVVYLYTPDNKKLKDWGEKEKVIFSMPIGAIVRIAPDQRTKMERGHLFDGSALYLGIRSGVIYLQRMDQLTGTIWSLSMIEGRYLEKVED